MCIFHYFNYYLPDFVTTICWGFILVSCFCIFILISLNAITNHLWNPYFWPEIKPWAFWSGSIDSKTLDYQRTNPREYEIVRTHTTETTWIQNAASSNHRVQDASSKPQTKQKYRPNHQQTGLPPPCQPKEKQTSKQKRSTNLILYEAYTNHWTNLRRAEIKRKKEFNLEAWEKETSSTIRLKK